MTHFAFDPDLTPMMDEDDDENVAVRPPVVDSKAAEDRLNPPTEYEVLELSGGPDALKKKLNEMGEEGWALVATTPAFIFRRMKKPEDKKPRGRVGFGF